MNPGIVQYFMYIKSMLQEFWRFFLLSETGDGGDLVSLAEYLILAMCAQGIAIILGILFGTIAAAFRGKKIDVTLLGTALFITPCRPSGLVSFCFHILACNWAGCALRYANPGPRICFDRAYLKDVAHHLVLPAVTFGLAITGSYTMIMRSALLDVFTEDYINTLN